MKLYLKISVVFAVIIISCLTLSSKVYAAQGKFNFDYISADVLAEYDFEQICNNAVNSYPADAVIPDFNGSRNSYGIKIHTLNDKLYNYANEDITQYISKSSDVIEYEFYYNNNSFIYYFFTDSSGNVWGYDYFPIEQNQYHTPKEQVGNVSYFLEKAQGFVDNGNVAFVEIPFGDGCDNLYPCAVISHNGKPEYVVFLMGNWLGGLCDIAEDDLEETTKLKTTANYLFNNGQRVFDFDFILEICKANHNMLSDGYVYKPYGLQSMCKNKIYEIDNVFYHFDKKGICQGKYTGWVTSKKYEGKKRYYDNGIRCHDMWKKINDKYYYFSENGGYFTGSVCDEIMILKNPYIEYSPKQIVVEFTIENPTNEIVSYIPLFELEYFDNGEWTKIEINDNFGWKDIAYGLGHGEGKLEINVTEQYGQLPNGTYRVVYNYLGDDKIVSESFEMA